MNTSIVGRHIKLTDAIKDYINSSIDTFKKYNLDIISVTSTIVGDEKAKGFTFEFSLNIANIDTVVIKQKNKEGCCTWRFWRIWNKKCNFGWSGHLYHG